MCLQLERLSSRVRMKPNWKHNMEYGERKAGYIFYLNRLCLKPPKSHPVPDVHSWCNLSPQMRDWQNHVNAQHGKRRLFESAHETKLLKGQFGTSHPTFFFSVWNSKLGFLYLNFPKTDYKILVKFACTLKSLNSLYITILNGLT